MIRNFFPLLKNIWFNLPWQGKVGSGVACVVLVWLLSPKGGSEHVPAEAASAVISVQTRGLKSQTKHREIIVRGMTTAHRTVTLRAAINGTVIDLPAEKGDLVEAGAVLVRLEPEERPAKINEAKANLEQRLLEHKAAIRLSAKSYVSETRLAEALSNLQKARADLDRATQDMKYTRITAPFRGILNDRFVEVGDYVGPGVVGNGIVTIVELDPIDIVVYVNEQEVDRLKIGQTAIVKLPYGEAIQAHISYISKVAEPKTRTYRIEMSASNPDLRVRDGMTADVKILLEPLQMYLINSSLLSLNEEGVIGVKIVDAKSTVQWIPVTLVATDPQGVWVSGLPDRINLITVGQDFVIAGQSVKTVSELAERPT